MPRQHPPWPSAEYDSPPTNAHRIPTNEKKVTTYLIRRCRVITIRSPRRCFRRLGGAQFDRCLGGGSSGSGQCWTGGTVCTTTTPCHLEALGHRLQGGPHGCRHGTLLSPSSTGPRCPPHLLLACAGQPGACLRRQSSYSPVHITWNGKKGDVFVTTTNKRSQ